MQVLNSKRNVLIIMLFLLVPMLATEGGAAMVTSPDMYVSNDASSATLGTLDFLLIGDSLSVDNQALYTPGVTVGNNALLLVGGITTVSSNGNDTTGIKVETGGIAGFNLDVRISGAGAVGVQTSGQTALDGSLSATDSAIGAKVEDGKLTVGGSLNVANSDSTGVVATGGNTYLASGNISDSGMGLQASGLAQVTISEDWYIHDGAVGTTVSGAADVTLEKQLLVDTGAIGAKVEGGKLTVEGLLKTSGTNSTGVAATGGEVSLAGGDILSDSTGLNASGTAKATIIEDWHVHDGAIGTIVSGNAEVAMEKELLVDTNATGAKVEDGKLTVEGSLYVANSDSTGVVATGGNTYLASGNISDSGIGLQASGKAQATISEDWVVGNNAATGVIVSDTAEVTMEKGLTVYDNAIGAVVEDGTLTIDGLLKVYDAGRGIETSGGLTKLADGDIYGGATGLTASGTAKVIISEDWSVYESDSTGIKVSDTAEVTMEKGLTVYDNATGAVVEDGTLKVEGNVTAQDNSYGVYITGGNTTLEKNLTATDHSYGAYIEGGTLTALGTVTADANSHGIAANGTGAVAYIDSVVVSGANSYGVYASNDSYIHVSEDISLTVDATGSYGAVADRDGLVDISGDIVSLADGASGSEVYGAFAQTNGTVNIDGSVDMTGDYSYGTVAQAAGIINVGTGIETKGNNSTAAYADGADSEINIVDLLGGGRVFAAANGADSYALFANDEGTINMTNGDVSAASASSWFLYTDLAGTINLNDVSADASHTLNLLQTTSSGNVNASVSTMTGDVTHTGLQDGTLALLLQEGSSLTGAANVLGSNPNARINITVDAETDLWLVTADSLTQGDLTNRGTVDFGWASVVSGNRFVTVDSDYKMITVDNFTGTTTSGDKAGRLLMKADINADKGDYIYGVGSATGTTEIDLQTITYAGKARMDQALIYMENGAASDAAVTLADNALTGNGVIDAGAWNYVLAEGMDGTAKEWYLKRNGLTSTGQGIIISAVTPEMWYTEVATLYDRMGNYKDPDYKGGIWAAAAYRKVEFDGAGGAFGMLPFDVKMKTLTIGYDKKREQSNGTWFNGIMFGYGEEKRENSVADSDTDSFHATIYTVYKQQSGFYLSALAKFNHYDTDLTVYNPDKLTQLLGYDRVTGGLNQRGLGMSLLAGKRFNIGEAGWYLEPQAQLSYMRIFGDKYITNSGLDVDVEATTSVRARTGVMLGKAITLNNGAALDLFADLSYNKEFKGKTDIWMSGGKYTRDLGDDWGSYGIGFSWRMGESSYLGGRIAYGSGSDREEPISATLGVLFELK